MNHFPFSLSFLLLLLLQCSKTLAQAPAAAPAPTGPANITKILEKAGHFTTLIRLLKVSQVGDRINKQLKKSTQGLTLLAPSDAAFASLKQGTLNSLKDEQKVSLLEFHVLPTFLPLSQFQTVSNPMRTQAGDVGPGQFPLNVTTSGNNVNISTGINKATVGATVYTDNQLAVYEVDHVLLPLNIYAPLPPAPVAPPPQPRKKSADSPGAAQADSSDAVGRAMHGTAAALGVAMFAAFNYL